MATIVTVGLDTSKSWFQAHGADAAGGAVLRTKLARSKVLTDRLPDHFGRKAIAAIADFGHREW